MISTKNMPLSPAASALGLGDALQTQVADQLAEQAKKKKMDNTAGALNPNTTGISAAVASLLGQTGAQ